MSSLFGSGSSSSSASANSADVKQQIMQQIQQQQAMANARTLIATISNNCFDKCIPTPGASLSSSENGCLSNCMEKYMAAWNVGAKVYTGRLQSESAAKGFLAGGS